MKHLLLDRIKLALTIFSSDEKSIDRIVEAMDSVDRKHFTSEKPYEDAPQPTLYGQTISQPSTVARMLVAAEIEPENDILEIGSGSGWSACLAGYLAYPGEVTSLEVIPELTQLAEENRRKANNYRLSKVKFRCSDIFKELPDRSYDRIIFTAGINDEQEKKIDELSKRLLKKNGILICPYKDGPLIIIKKNRFFQKKKYTKEHYRFVPLVS